MRNCKGEHKSCLFSHHVLMRPRIRHERYIRRAGALEHMIASGIHLHVGSAVLADSGFVILLLVAYY